MNLNLHKALYLHKTPSKLYLQPVEEPNEALIIDRKSIKLSFDSMFTVDKLPCSTTSSLICGIIGIKELLSDFQTTRRSLDTYLIVINNATSIGMISNEPIYRMNNVQMILIDSDPPAKGTQMINHDGINWPNINKDMIESVLKVQSYYFSYSYDLTNTLQRMNSNQSLLETSTGRRTYENYDERFIWNADTTKFFNGYPQASRYRLPFILGFVSINTISLDSVESFNYILISRRSVRRAGTRYNSRGIDSDGNVSNFVETEQIVEDFKSGFKASFVQVRGSIPLFWSQQVDHLYRYKPPISINEPLDICEQAMKKHFNDLTKHYGSLSLVSLIDQVGSEAELQRVFSETVSRVQGYYPVPYHYFDFHKECSKMRWYRLTILLERMKQEIESYGFYAIWDNKVLQLQNGVIRTNCIDSLDRTNVVQSMIAQYVLELQMQRFVPPHISTKLESYPEFMQIFKNTWADNADALSIQYAGTPALKTDFTRTGKRTQVGLVKDGINSLARYLTNNFHDDYRQDAIDLFLGYISVSDRYKPWVSKRYHIVVVVAFILLYIYIRFL